MPPRRRANFFTHVWRCLLRPGQWRWFIQSGFQGNMGPLVRSSISPVWKSPRAEKRSPGGSMTWTCMRFISRFRRQRRKFRWRSIFFRPHSQVVSRRAHRRRRIWQLSPGTSCCSIPKVRTRATLLSKRIWVCPPVGSSARRCRWRVSRQAKLTSLRSRSNASSILRS